MNATIPANIPALETLAVSIGKAAMEHAARIIKARGIAGSIDLDAVVRELRTRTVEAVSGAAAEALEAHEALGSGWAQISLGASAYDIALDAVDAAVAR